jgi:protocatechuate 3,4-dioxygenase beta subunit
VKVEIWQANHEREHKNDTKCRGFVRTNNHGFYELVTIYPGKYSSSADGRDLRPAHLHFKINGRKEKKVWRLKCILMGTNTLDILTRVHLAHRRREI